MNSVAHYARSSPGAQIVEKGLLPLPMLADAEKQVDGKLIEPFVAQIALAERCSIEGVGLQRCCRR